MCLQRVNPAVEGARRPLDKADQPRRRGFFIPHPFVHHLFAIPGDITEIVEPNHASATLERVIAAPNGDKRFRVDRIRTHRRQILAQRRHHFVGFLEKNFQQFLIDFGGGRIDQVDGLRRGRVSAFFRHDA